VLLSRKAVPPVFFDLDDIEHKAFVRNLRQPPFWHSKFLQYLKVPSLLWLERRAIALAQKTFVCSETDRGYLVKLFRQLSVVTIPNAIELPPMHESPANSVFLFLGTYKHLPNIAAVEFLVNKIWPGVKRKLPDAKLIIAGKNPENIKSYREKHAGVEYRGFVEDLDKLYRETHVVCCPVQSGSGTRIKIIEAAAYGKPIVSTSLGAEGLDFEDGSEILIRDDCDSFAESCVAMANNMPLCEKIGKAAREKAKRLYGKSNVMTSIQNEIQDNFSFVSEEA
jgi:glycosyltransferase involved in cell wall biosynthesis